MADIDALRIQTYSDSLEMLSQQKTPRLAMYCRQEDGTPGQKAHRMLSQIKKTSVSERTTRFEDIDNTLMEYDGRWVYWKQYHHDTTLDGIDLRQTNLTPTGQIVDSQVAAHNREMDDKFIASFFANAQTGETGGTTTSFDSNNVVAVTEGGGGSNVGMNVEKMRTGKRILMENDVDLDSEAIYMGVSPKLHDDLLALTQVVSTDFNTRPILGTNGMVTQFLGVNIVVHNRFTTDSNSYERVPMWVASGMGCAFWQRLTGRIQEVPSKKGSPVKIESEMAYGFTRLEETKCIEIKCTR